MLKLRPYQAEAVQAVKDDWQAGYTDVLGTAATGLGKTAIFLALLNDVLTDGKRGLVLAHRKELIEQPLERLHQYFPHWQGRAGIVMAELNEPHKQLVIATVQTLNSGSRLDDIGHIDYLITDEAHHAPSQTYRNVYEQLKAVNPDMRHLGVTATPIRADGDGLSGIYQKESFHYGIVEGIRSGFLAPVRWLAIQTAVSVKGIASRDGDFVARQLKNVYETANVFDLVVETHQKYADGRQAVAFTVTVDGAYSLADAFRRAGIKAEAADGTTNKRERGRILDRFQAGETDVLCNVGLYTEGLDVPQASCIHQVRPTRSDGLYTQMVGRGLRTFPGKQDCIAEGQLVLTDNGLIPIEKVTKEMRVWDGESFVNHAGAICKGYQEVITYAGLTATPDHKVWTKYGWRQFGECARNRTAIAVTGDGGAAIREIDGYQRNTCVQRQVEKETVHTYALHNLWSRGAMESRKRPARACGLPQMWAQSNPRPGSVECSRVALQASTGRTSTLYEPKRTQLPTLWWARDRIPVQVASGNGRVGCIESWFTQGYGVRSNQQRWALRTRKSTVGNSYTECCQQHKGESERRVPCLSHETPRNSLCGYYVTAPSFERDDIRGNLPAIQQQVLQTKRRVWDILSAGPLHRFTVEGLLVSNCLVLDYAPIEVRNIAMMGDVLGTPLRKDAYVEEKELEGEVLGGFTFDGSYNWLEGNPAEIISRQLNYLDVSPWSWYRRDGYMSLGLGKGSDDVERTLVIGPPQDGMMSLYLVARRDGERSWRAYDALVGATWAEISEWAEDYAGKRGNAVLAAKSRSWRRQPTTDAQIKYAKRIKGAYKPGMSKGELAQSITHALALQSIERLQQARLLSEREYSRIGA